MAECIILDTGALIGVERKNPEIVHALREARRKRYRILLPSVAYAEWIRGANQGLGKAVGEIAEHVGGEREVARLAGEALKALNLDGKLHLADAIVAAAARHYGGLLYTSDPDDMRRLLEVMPGRAVEIVRI